MRTRSSFGLFEGRRPRDDFDELGSDTRLASAVVDEGKAVDHFPGILACVLHGVHARRLLRSGALHKAVPYLRRQKVLVHVLRGDAGRARGGGGACGAEI